MLIEVYLTDTTDPLVTLDFTGVPVGVPEPGERLVLVLFDDAGERTTRTVSVAWREFWYVERHPTRGTPRRAEVVLYVTEAPNTDREKREADA